MQNSVELLEDGIIFVVKVGNQTGQSLFELMGQIVAMADLLRDRGQAVLVLSDLRQEGTMDPEAVAMARKIGQELDFDKSATFGAPESVLRTRQRIAKDTQVHAKVRDFATREQAVAWLRS